MKKKFLRVFNRLSGREKGILKQKIESQYQKIQVYAERIQKLQVDYDLLLDKHENLLRTQGSYGAVNVGNKEMEEKWRSAPKGKRILFITTKDFAGSFFKWAKSLHKYSDYAVRMVSLATHQYGYELDLFFSARNDKYYKEILPLLKEADAVHFKDEQVPFLALANPAAQSNKESYRLRLPAPKADDFMRFVFKNSKDKPKIFTHYGSFARLWQNDDLYKDFVKNNFTSFVAMTADLNFDWFAGKYVPQAIDVDKFEYVWKDTKTIAHSPSTASRKGTNEFMEAAQKIVETYPDWKIDLIQGLKHDECLRRKRQASLFFDQAGKESNDLLAKGAVIGFYGNSALEAMVHGIPTIAHIAQWAFDGAARGGKDWSTSPILNPKPTDVESMKEIIEQFVKMSPQERQALSLRTREWTVSNHGEQFVARDLASVYDETLKISR